MPFSILQLVVLCADAALWNILLGLLETLCYLQYLFHIAATRLIIITSRGLQVSVCECLAVWQSVLSTVITYSLSNVENITFVQFRISDIYISSTDHTNIMMHTRTS